MKELDKIVNEEISSFVNENQDSHYYISAGKGGKMYTLRQSWTEDDGYGGVKERDYHVATLSNDLEKAKEKANQKLGYVPNVEYGEELGQIKQTKTFEHMPNGNHQGTHFKDVPTEYLTWWIGYYQQTQSYQKIIRSITNHFQEQGLFKPIVPQNIASYSDKDIQDYIKYGVGLPEFDTTKEEIRKVLGNDLYKVKTNIDVFPFGKWKGTNINDVPREYLEWMMKNMISGLQGEHFGNPGAETEDDIYKDGVSKFVLNFPWIFLDIHKKTLDKLKVIAAIDYHLKNREVSPEEIAKEKASQAKDYIGNIGEKVEADITVTMVKDIETQFGSTLLVKMVDAAGNNITTFGNNAFTRSVEEGSKAKIIGTVKKQEEYRGEKGTQLVRVKQI